ncbi:PorP/SprF family type IX secretion system membrane protein [Cytophagaceae bacterium ABcell3]|nr:PorP/SprF family type IX secretion system membrane protein [Cytophagaceae bacterium ABcell3]
MHINVINADPTPFQSITSTLVKEKLITELYKIVFLVLALLGFHSAALAQADKHNQLLDQYIFNPLVINPAYAGKNQALTAVAHHRYQDHRFSAGRLIQSVSLHSPIGGENYNVGGIIALDRFGDRPTADVMAMYAWRIPVKKGHLSLGVQGGARFIGHDLNTFDDENTLGNAILPRFGGGVYYHVDDFFVGLALPDNVISTINIPETISNIVPHRLYTFIIGNTFRVNENFDVLPSVLLRRFGSGGVFADFNGSVIYDKRFSIGGSFRPERSIALITQMELGQFNIGYSFERWAHRWSGITARVHELVLTYNFRYNVKTVHPRNFK